MISLDEEREYNKMISDAGVLIAGLEFEKRSVQRHTDVLKQLEQEYKMVAGFGVSTGELPALFDRLVNPPEIPEELSPVWDRKSEPDAVLWGLPEPGKWAVYNDDVTELRELMKERFVIYPRQSGKVVAQQYPPNEWVFAIQQIWKALGKVSRMIVNGINNMFNNILDGVQKALSWLGIEVR